MVVPCAAVKVSVGGCVAGEEACSFCRLECEIEDAGHGLFTAAAVVPRVHACEKRVDVFSGWRISVRTLWKRVFASGVVLK